MMRSFLLLGMFASVVAVAQPLLMNWPCRVLSAPVGIGSGSSRFGWDLRDERRAAPCRNFQALENSASILSKVLENRHAMTSNAWN